MTDGRNPKPPGATPGGAAGKQSTRRNRRVAGPIEARSVGALGFAVKFVAIHVRTRVKLARAVLQVLRERKKTR